MQEATAVRLELQALSLLFRATGGRLAWLEPRGRSAWTNETGWAELLALTTAPDGSALEIPPSVLRRTLEASFPSLFGVHFDKNRVVAVDLSRNGLVGTLPTEIASLRALQAFKLRHNPGLRGPLPPAFLAHPPPQLRCCYLDGTRLERALPYASAHAVEITRVHDSGTAVTVRFSTGGRTNAHSSAGSAATTHWMVDVTEAELFMMHSALVAAREQQLERQPAPATAACTAANATGPERVAAATKLQRIYRARIERSKFRRFLRSLFETHVDPSSGARYFVDTRTGRASWQRPSFVSTPRLGGAAVDAQEHTAGQSTGESTVSGDEWQPYDDGNGNTYYWNRTTGESTWESPLLRSRLHDELTARYGPDKTDAERLDLLFDEVDADRTGAVDRDEFARLCGDLGMALSAAQVAHVFRELDASGDGQLSRHETSAWLTRHF